MLTSALVVSARGGGAARTAGQVPPRPGITDTEMAAAAARGTKAEQQEMAGCVEMR